MGDMPNPGETAPDFKLSANDGNDYQLADFQGSWVLLYFYPKNDTPGCTKQACSLRDSWGPLQDAGIKVLGINTDSIESHKKFVKKHNLPFPLLSDTKKEVVKAYGVKGTFFTKRKSFLIAPDGKIAAVFDKVDVSRHGEEVLEKHSQLAGAGASTGND
jgi:peroxiredoxin Q/BCP